MDEQKLQQWQILHRRSVMGESLTASERAEYETGCQELDAEEVLDGNLKPLRELRAKIMEAETEQQRMRQREVELKARIVELETQLDTRSRQLLGIGS